VQLIVLDIISGCEEELFSSDLLMADDTDFGLLSSLNSTPLSTPVKEESMKDLDIKQEAVTPPLFSSSNNNSPQQRGVQVTFKIKCLLNKSLNLRS